MLRLALLFSLLLAPIAAHSAGGVMEASYGPDVDVYPHRIMGRIQEKQTLFVVDENGQNFSLTLKHNVFEDMAPHIADMDGDGRNDVVVVETNPDKGASLAIYSLAASGLFKLAETPHIGQPFRWLAPAGIADFDGDGQNDVAYVETPHLGKLLRFWTIRGGKLVEIAAAKGLTNHRIGDEAIAGGVRDCTGSVEVVTANANWTHVIATRLVDGAPKFTTVGPYNGPKSFENALACR